MLQPATLQDAAYFYSLYMHPAINPYLLYDPMPEKDFEPVFEDLIQKGVLYIFIADGIAAGMCKIIPHSYRNAHMMYLGGVAIHPDLGGKGYGYTMMQEIIQFARDRGLRRIELSTSVENAVAIRLYERVGFVIEGRLRNYTWFKHENRFLDEFIMSWID